MDYHFYQAPKTVQKARFQLRKTLVYFLPVFMAAILLPILVGIARRPVPSTFRADASENELSIWIEPANVQVSVNKPVTLTVMALFNSESNLLPGISVPLIAPQSAQIDRSLIEYKHPFSGQVKIGEFQIMPSATGRMEISIDKANVISETFNQNLSISISSANILVH